MASPLTEDLSSTDDSEAEDDFEDDLPELAQIEMVGSSFLLSYLRRKYQESIAASKDDDSSPTAALPRAASPRKKKKKKKAKKAKSHSIKIDSVDLDNFDPKNHYSVLGIEEYTIVATAADVSYAYKRLQQLCHPDKFSSGPKASQLLAQERFKLLETAYDTLGNGLYKRLYDSTLAFDDSIPSQHDLSTRGFLKADFKPVPEMGDTFDFDDAAIYPFTGDLQSDSCIVDAMVAEHCVVKPKCSALVFAYMDKFFVKWATLSVKKPMPRIGDTHSSLKHVRRFYKLWEAMRSWRDFTHMCDKVDIYDLRHAENNSELKMMKKVNERLQARFKLAEKIKIEEMVALCKSLDSRLIRFELEERYSLWKEHRERESRRLAKESAKLETERKERQRVDDIRTAQVKALRAKEREKERITRETRQLPIDLRKMCIKNPLFAGAAADDEIETVCLNATLKELHHILEPSLKDTRGIESEVHKLQLRRFKEVLPSAKKQAAAKRQKVMEDLRERKQKEMAKYGAKPWTVEQLQWLTTLCSKFPRGTSNRWEQITRSFAKKYESRTQKQLIATAADLQKGKLQLHTSAKAKKRKAKSGASAAQSSETASKSELDTALTAVLSKYSGSVTDDQWTAHQSKLEAALKRLMPEKKKKGWTAPRFWDEVSAKLGGEKTSAECQSRFKFVREVLMLKKKYGK